MKPIFLALLGFAMCSCNKSPSNSNRSDVGDKVRGENVGGNQVAIADATPTEPHPALKTPDELLNYLRSQPAALEKPGLIRLLQLVPGSYENKEIIDCIRQRYLLKREEGLYHGAAAAVLMIVKDREIAPVLLADAERMNPLDFSGLSDWQIASLLSQNHKYMALRALVQIGEPTSIEGMWRHFDEGTVNTKRLIARAVGSSGDVEQARACLDRLRNVTDDTVRQELQDAANGIVFNALPVGDNTRAVQIAQELKEAGLARDYLVEKLPK
jgi:hypothetical protein